jgi:tetratricopeptide (TPR) repeat protein
MLFLSGLASSQARSEDRWIGQRVVQKSPDFAPQLDHQVQARQRAILFYRVERAEGHRLWIEAERGGARGWITDDQVVPIDQAVEFFTRRISADPRDTFARIMRANLRRDRRQFDLALQDCDEAVRISPNQAWVLTNRGLARFETRAFDEAIADFTEAIRLEPRDAKLYFDRGLAWGHKGDHDRAIADFNQVLRLDPGKATAYYSRAIAWKSKAEYGKALADYEGAIRLDPGYTAAYNNRAVIWAACPEARYRDGAKAVASATKACELSAWKDPHRVATLAAAYAEAGDFGAAVKWQAKAIELLPAGKSRDDYRARLEFYQDKRPYRSPR